MSKAVFIKGNEAAAWGALAAGCRCYFGYPITPQNEIPELLSLELPRRGGSFVQAESEVAAANMLLGASAGGVPAMVSSSSPGISLMQEAISYMAGSELPGVIINVNRGGPGLGDIGPSQGDYFQSTRGGGHGDYRTLVLAPASCQEMHDLTIRAFELSFHWRNPVLILGDSIVGTMKEPVILAEPDSRVASDSSESWHIDGAAGREKRLIKSLFLDEGALAAHNRFLMEKYAAMAVEADAEEYLTEDADLVVAAFGSVGRMVKGAVRQLRAEGLRVGLFRPITLFPFPSARLRALARPGRRFLTIEHNTGQMVEDVRLFLAGAAESALFAIMPGDIPAAEDLLDPIRQACREGKI